MLAIVYEKAKFLSAKPLVFLGSISYALYLIHQFFGYSIMRAFQANGQSAILAIGVAIAVSILLATVMTHYIEKPSLHYLRKKYAAWMYGGAAEPVIVNSTSAGKALRFDPAEELSTMAKKPSGSVGAKVDLTDHAAEQKRR